MGPSFGENDQNLAPNQTKVSPKRKPSTTAASAARLAFGEHRYAGKTHG